MRISISVTDFSWPDGAGGLAGALDEIVRAADEGGLDTVWLSDHLIQAAPGSTPDSEMLEAYTALGFLAGRTERVRLGTMVAAVSYRAPAVLIKAVTTLDVLSGGRAWLGIGAGYQADEAAAMGLPLPPTAERFEHLDETLRIALQMWAGDRSPFHGRHHTLERPVESPQPLSRPHPPILIGGAGERKTLRLVAQYGDACNLFDIPDGGATVRHKLDGARAALRRRRPSVRGDRQDGQHAARAGRAGRRVRRALRAARRARDRARRGDHHRAVGHRQAWRRSRRRPAACERSDAFRGAQRYH